MNKLHESLEGVLHWAMLKKHCSIVAITATKGVDLFCRVCYKPKYAVVIIPFTFMHNVHAAYLIFYSVILIALIHSCIIGMQVVLIAITFMYNDIGMQHIVLFCSSY